MTAGNQMSKKNVFPWIQWYSTFEKDKEKKGSFSLQKNEPASRDRLTEVLKNHHLPPTM